MQEHVGTIAGLTNLKYLIHIEEYLKGLKYTATKLYNARTIINTGFKCD